MICFSYLNSNQTGGYIEVLNLLKVEESKVRIFCPWKVKISLNLLSRLVILLLFSPVKLIPLFKSVIGAIGRQLHIESLF